MTFASGDPYRHLTLYRKALIVVHRHRPRSAGETASSAVLDEVKPRSGLFPLDFLRHLCHRTIYFHPIWEPPRRGLSRLIRNGYAVMRSVSSVEAPPRKTGFTPLFRVGFVTENSVELSRLAAG